MPESIKAAALALVANAEARWVALVVAIFLIVYLVRKFAPKAWLWFETRSPFVVADPAPVLVALHKAFQAIPSVVLGMVIPAGLTGGDWKAALFGGLLGLLPPLKHELFKWIEWLPYRGALGRVKTKSEPGGPPAGDSRPVAPVHVVFANPRDPDETPPSTAAFRSWRFAPLALVLLLTGCGLFTAATAKTAADIAHDLCVMHYGKEKPALSLDDVAKTYCKDIDPWVDSLLGAERLGAAKARAAHP